MKIIGYACRHPDPPLRKAYLPLNDLTVLLGPNDSGKSSLLRAVECDLSGGHFDHVDDETKILIGGVFYAEVSKDELWAIVGIECAGRNDTASAYGTCTGVFRHSPHWSKTSAKPSKRATCRSCSVDVPAATVCALSCTPRLPALWTFASHDGVQPTNNHAERALRSAVIYRKLSLGSQSQGGEQRTARLLSAHTTCRLQHRSPLRLPHRRDHRPRPRRPSATTQLSSPGH